MEDDIQRADNATKYRAYVAPFVALVFFSTHQWLFFGREWSDVADWQLGAWLVLSAAMLVLLITGGLVLFPRRIRRLMDDEASRASRDAALRAGFGMAMFTALLVFAVSPFEPIEAQRAAHFIVSMGVGIGFLTLGLQEMRHLD